MLYDMTTVALGAVVPFCPNPPGRGGWFWPPCVGGAGGLLNVRVVSTFTLSGNDTARSMKLRVGSSCARGEMRCAGENSSGACVNSRETSTTIELSGPYASTLNTARIASTFAACPAPTTGDVVSLDITS